MKIGIANDGPMVSAHFGHCESYTIYDVHDRRIVHREEIPNPGHEPGVLPGMLASWGVTDVIAGGMGPKAEEIFHKLGINTFVGVFGPVDDIARDFVEGCLNEGRSACRHQ